MKFPTYKEMGEKVAEQALDEYVINGKTLREWIKLLSEQEPCTDAVSREAVLDLCDSKDPNYLAIHFKEDIECLPSVRPQEQTGHWINKEEPTCDTCEYNTAAFMPCNACEDKSEYKPQESDHKCHTCKHYTSGERDGSCGSYICKGYSNWESEDKE